MTPHFTSPGLAISVSAIRILEYHSAEGKKPLDEARVNNKSLYSDRVVRP